MHFTYMYHFTHTHIIYIKQLQHFLTLIHVILCIYNYDQQLVLLLSYTYTEFDHKHTKQPWTKHCTAVSITSWISRPKTVALNLEILHKFPVLHHSVSGHLKHSIDWKFAIIFHVPLTESVCTWMRVCKRERVCCACLCVHACMRVCTCMLRHVLGGRGTGHFRWSKITL